jgi:hypothetical protein
MTLTYVSGDPLLTQAQVLAFGHNAKGRTELGTLETALLHHFPAAFAAYRKQCRRQRIHSGMIWIWRESQPQLAFLVVRESSVGATRIRFVQSAVMTLARDYHLESIESLALAPLGRQEESAVLKSVIDYWLGSSALPVVVYENYLPGVRAREAF